jgi:hypothetical protein
VEVMMCFEEDMMVEYYTLEEQVLLVLKAVVEMPFIYNINFH